VGRFQYYTIYRCKSCGQRVRVLGKLASQLVLPPGVTICCAHPQLRRERQILISDFKAGRTESGEAAEQEAPQQRRLIEFAKGKR
jgi:hypothetical protein